MSRFTLPSFNETGGGIERAVVVDEHGDRLAIGRKDRLRDGAVEVCGEDSSLASGGGDNGELAAVVFVKLGLAAVDVGDQLAVGTPRGMAAVVARRSAQLPRLGIWPRRDDEDIGVGAAIGVGVVVADVDDLAAVGRPRCLLLFELLVGGELCRVSYVSMS